MLTRTKETKGSDQAIEEGGELATRYDVRNTRLQGWQKLSRAVEPCTRKEKKKRKGKAELTTMMNRDKKGTMPKSNRRSRRKR